MVLVLFSACCGISREVSIAKENGIKRRDRLADCACLLLARISKATNWAAASFMLGSVIQFEVCRYQREEERKSMARVVEVMDRKQAEKKAKADEAARLREEAREKAKQAAQKSWYKFW